MRIEDIEIDDTARYIGKMAIDYTDTLGGKLPRGVQKLMRRYMIHNVGDKSEQVMELLRNPEFSPILADSILGEKPGYVDHWDMIMDKEHIRGLKFGLRDVPGPRQFLLESGEVEFHDRWKYGIMEDFYTDGDWPAHNVNVVTPLTSSGYGKQEQDIVWEELVGNFVGNDQRWIVGEKCIRTGTSAGEDLMVAGHDWWSDYEISCWFWNLNSASDDFGIVFRCADENKNYIFQKTSTNLLKLQYDDTGYTLIKQVTTANALLVQTWYHMRVVCQGPRIRCYFNNELVIDVMDTRYPSGRVGIRSNEDWVYCDDFRCTLMPPVNFNLPASVDWTNQYSVGDIATAYGTQKKIIEPVGEVEFKASKAGGDCVLYLPMDEGEGTPKDHSKNRNVVTRTGGTWVKDDEKGWVLEWNGTAGDFVYVDLPNNSPSYYTIDFEMRSDSVLYSYAVTFEGLDPLWYIGGDDTTWSWYFDGVSRFDYPEENMNVNQWYRITFVANAVDNWTECYVDGVLVGRITSTGVDPLGDDYMAIGASYSGAVPWRGAIREVRVFDTIRQDVAYGFDSTPATVFCWDDNRYNPNVDYPDDSNLALYWKLDEGSGIKAWDASGKGIDSDSWAGTPDWLDTSFRGEAGTAIRFVKASNENIARSGITGYADGLSEVTGECWVKFRTATQQDGFFYMRHTAGAYRPLQMRKSENGTTTDYLQVQVADDNGNIRLWKSTDTLDIGKWYHIVVTHVYPTDDLHVYINGVEDAGTKSGTATNTVSDDWAQLMIGSDVYGYGDVDMDEIRIHTEALSANEIAARHRSEPYLHDWYQMTRAYHKGHPFGGLPVISNGLVMISFPDYDIYEYRSANVLWPCVYGWFENSWHFLGTISPTIYANAYRSYIGYYTGCDWEIEELTDQYCKIRIRYYKDDVADWPEGIYHDSWLIIRNGFPGVLIEYDDRDPFDDGNTGLMFRSDYGYGTGREWRFLYVPKDNFVDADIAGATGNITLANSDDNWAIMFHDRDRSNALSKNAIVGLFKDTMTGNITNSFFWGDGQDVLGQVHSYDHKYGGVFFMPYDVDLLFNEWEDAYDATQYYNTLLTVFWNKEIRGGAMGAKMTMPASVTTAGVYWDSVYLEKGSYVAVSRTQMDNRTGDFLWLGIDDDGASGSNRYNTWSHGYTLISNTVDDTWQYGYHLFHIDTAGTYYIKVEGQANGLNNMWFDYWNIITLNNGVNYPANLAHQGLNKTKVRRI